ncbi:MAG: protein arginine kinase [Planctomycetales bacterium]|nr:protein arginine kinase [Planctomycetales bacterium]
MDLSDLARQSGEWLRGTGPESDIVISTRIRLARNVAGHTFNTVANDDQKAEIAQIVAAAIKKCRMKDVMYVPLKEAARLDCLLLLERHLISKELATSDGERGVAFGRTEMRSIMVNEEDHLRSQVLRSGFQPEVAWDEVNQVDDQLAGKLDFAFHPQFGYLTACPTNVGTGMRVSIMLHLPALVALRQIDKVFSAVSKMNLAVRGLYGEGTHASGDFYQISNQVTLGKSEVQIIEDVKRVVPKIVSYERKTRETWVKDDPKSLEDKVWRAYGMLRAARRITSEETMDLLSAVRMGVNMEVIPDLEIRTVNELFIQSQPAHLQRIEGQELNDHDRDIARASFIRSRLGDGKN